MIKSLGLIIKAFWKMDKPSSTFIIPGSTEGAAALQCVIYSVYSSSFTVYGGIARNPGPPDKIRAPPII